MKRARAVLAYLHLKFLKFALHIHINQPSKYVSQTGFVLRMATSNDSALIASMHARSWAAAYRGILPDTFLDKELADDRAAHWNTRFNELAGGAGEVFIAVVNDQPAGFVCVIAPDETGSVLVDNLHAMPEARGTGLGTAMLATASQWAADRGAKNMHLYVLEPNVAAIGFYESHGWRLAGREDDTMGGIDIIALRYTLPIG
ncbi:N-acetyltransferase GCN5 [Caballeronia sordidicola]|uniref:N-acetyltransferase GCN5 n=2 Tax=Burkholderiaceae TaxID=119060 RepID=A0A158GKI7_CABSO|nr:N-acetyltransferase GCN5 [Caballeronia sordidicola]